MPSPALDELARCARRLGAPAAASREDELAQPAEQGNERAGEKRRPEAVAVEMAAQARRDRDQSSVDDEQEQAERDDDQRQADQSEQGADDGVDDSKQQRDPHEGSEASMDVETRHEPRDDSEDDRKTGQAD